MRQKLLQKRRSFVDKSEIGGQEIFGRGVDAEVVQIEKVDRSRFVGLGAVDDDAAVRSQARLKEDIHTD